MKQAKQRQATEAAVNSFTGKAQSCVMSSTHVSLHILCIFQITDDSRVCRAVGYLTGNQSRQTQGNLETEKAQWSYKQATSDGPIAIPLPSKEGLKGKLESVEGMVKGDMEEQTEGNIRAEKAAWKDGV